MKHTTKFMIAMALVFHTIVSFAAPNPKQVQEAMKAKNWGQAQSMLQEVIKEKPKSAVAWFLIAQVYEQQGNKNAARQALLKAKELDPSIRFAKNPDMEAAMEKRLGISNSGDAPNRNSNSGNNSNSTRIASNDRGERTERTERKAPRSTESDSPRVGSHVSLPTPPSGVSPSYETAGKVAATAGAATIAANSPDSKAKPADSAHQESSGGGGWFIALILIAAAGGVAYFFYAKNESKKANEQRDTDRRALLTRALDAQTRAEKLMKMARFDAPEGSSFVGTAQMLSSSANGAISRLKGSANASTFSAREEDRLLDDLEARLDRAETQAARKAWTEEEVRPAPSPAPSAPVYQDRYVDRSPAPSYPQPGHAPVQPQQGYNYPQQAPAPTVIVQDSGPSLLSTVLIADALSSHGSGRRERELERDLERERERNREREYERQRERDQEREEERQRAREREDDNSWSNARGGSYSEPEPAYEPPPVDLGNVGSDWNDSGSSDSGSSDSGSSDSSSSSSSNDDWN